MRSPGCRFATPEMGSALPLRETFISTRGPRRSNGATSAAVARGALVPRIQSSSALIPTLPAVLTGEAENTPASLSGLGLDFLWNFDRALIIARREDTPTVCVVEFARSRRPDLQFLGA